MGRGLALVSYSWREMFSRSILRRIGLISIALLFLSSGTLHFIRTETFVKIVPPYIPFRYAAVYVSGVAELAGGMGLLIPRLRCPAAWGLVALLVAVFPANVYMATNEIQVPNQRVAVWVLWARLPLQAVLIWLVVWSSKPMKDKPARGSVRNYL